MLTSCYVKIYIFGQSVVLLLHTPVTWQQSQLQAIQNLLLPTFAPLTSCCVFLLNSFSIDFVWVYIFFNADQAEYVQYNCFVPNIPGPASLQPLHGVEPNTMFDIVLQQRKQWAYNHPFKPLLNPPPPHPVYPAFIPCHCAWYLAELTSLWLWHEGIHVHQSSQIIHGRNTKQQPAPPVYIFN